MIADESVITVAVAVEPSGNALVQTGSLGFGQGCVGGIAEEDVVEAVTVLAGLGSRGRMNDARRESEERTASTGPSESAHDAAGELSSGHSGPLDETPLGVGEPPNPTREDRLKCRWRPASPPSTANAASCSA